MGGRGLGFGLEQSRLENAAYRFRAARLRLGLRGNPCVKRGEKGSINARSNNVAINPRATTLRFFVLIY